jgi:putative selenate reductase FAD-binding subunit
MIEQFFRPDSLGQAIELKAQYGIEAVYMGGGSKLNATPTRTTRRIAISLDNLGLTAIERKQGQLHIGSMVTLQTLKDHPDTPAALKEALGFVYSRNVRNQSTLGGEVAASGHEGVLLPVLLVLEADVLLENDQREPLERYLAGPREALVLGLALPDTRLRCATRRIARNADGLTVLAAAVALDPLGAQRIALSCVTPAARLHEVEPLNLEAAPLEAAVARAIEPVADLCGSVEYKRYIAGVVVADLLVDCQQQEEK